MHSATKHNEDMVEVFYTLLLLQTHTMEATVKDVLSTVHTHEAREQPGDWLYLWQTEARSGS